MKRLLVWFTLFTFMGVAAFAAENGSGKIRLDSAVKVGSVELPAGEYKVTWTGSGDNTRVTLKQGKVTATTTAKLVSEQRRNDAVVTKSENGSRVLTQIQFRDATLLINGTPSTSEPAGR